jgi:hypothetical protein
LNLWDAKDITGALAVHEIRDGKLRVIHQSRLRGVLYDSTLLHEAVEAALESAGVAQAHSLAFLVEWLLYPEVIQLKLKSPGQYTKEDLRHLIEDTPIEIALINAMSGVSEKSKALQIANAEEVAKRAESILTSRPKAPVRQALPDKPAPKIFLPGWSYGIVPIWSRDYAEQARQARGQLAAALHAPAVPASFAQAHDRAMAELRALLAKPGEVEQRFKKILAEYAQGRFLNKINDPIEKWDLKDIGDLLGSQATLTVSFMQNPGLYGAEDAALDYQDYLQEVLTYGVLLAKFGNRAYQAAFQFSLPAFVGIIIRDFYAPGHYIVTIPEVLSAYRKIMGEDLSTEARAALPGW